MLRQSCKNIYCTAICLIKRVAISFQRNRNLSPNDLLSCCFYASIHWKSLLADTNVYLHSKTAWWTAAQRNVAMCCCCVVSILAAFLRFQFNATPQPFNGKTLHSLHLILMDDLRTDSNYCFDCWLCFYYNWAMSLNVGLFVTNSKWCPWNSKWLII